MARTIIEELVTLLGFQTDKAGAREALRTYTDLHHAARDLVGIAGRATQALLQPLQKVVKLGEAAFLTGKRLGMTAEEVQSLEISAKLTGVPVAALTRVIEHLGVAQYKANTRHKEQVLAFGRLGVSTHDMNGKLKTSSALFYESLAALSKMPNAGRRTGIAFQLMGEQAGKVMPLIAMGPGYFMAVKEAAEEAGAVLSNETAAAARDLSFWWQLLELRTESLEKRFGAGLLPIASKIVGTLLMLWSANKKVIDQRMDIVIKHTENAVYNLAKILRSALATVEDVVQGLGGFKNVLAFLEVLIGVVFFAALGAATVAVIRFGVALLFANALPILFAAAFGMLLGVLGLVIQDLDSTDSLLLELWNNPWNNPSDPPILKTLRAIVKLIKDIKDGADGLRQLGENAGQAIGGGGSLNDMITNFFLRNQGLEDRPSGARPEYVSSYGARVPLKDVDVQGPEAFRMTNTSSSSMMPMSSEEAQRAARGSSGEKAWGAYLPKGMRPEITINQVINGPVDLEMVKTATTSALNEAAGDERLRALFDAVRSGHQ